MYWTLGFVIGSAIVLIVAALLIAMLFVARNIRRLAAEALSVAAEIETATTPIWGIAGANNIVSDIARVGLSIESRVKAIASVLARS
jgi:hypothetical protein